MVVCDTAPAWWRPDLISPDLLRNWAVDMARTYRHDLPVDVAGEIADDIADDHVADAVALIDTDPAVPARDRAMFRRYYLDGYLLRELAAEHGISEARACRVIGALTERAARKIRAAARC